jgi:hypothetical protein
MCLALLHPGPVAAQADTKKAADTREAAPRTQPERQFILAQMRLFLETVQAITTQAASGNTAGVAANARGCRADVHPTRPASLDAKETPAWKAMMSGTCTGFDQVADLARTGAPTPRIIGALGDTLGNCVACHQSYRLTSEAK